MLKRTRRENEKLLLLRMGKAGTGTTKHLRTEYTGNPVLGRPQNDAFTRPCERVILWPTNTFRAGHTSVIPSPPLSEALAAMGTNFARAASLPCQFNETAKFRNGADRLWCPVHQVSQPPCRPPCTPQSLRMQFCAHMESIYNARYTHAAQMRRGMHRRTQARAGGRAHA